MQETALLILDSLRLIDDTRVDRTKRHSLELILFVAVCAYLCGCEGFNEMELFAEENQEWLRAELGMSGVPSHDTFNRVFQAIDPAQFGQCLIALAARLRGRAGAAAAGGVVAFDGKTHRGTGKGGAGMLHTLNAWSAAGRLVLGQLAVDAKSNEITAILQLMDLLDLKGCVGTADALNTQKSVAAKAVEKGADWLLPLKGNHPLAEAEVGAFMEALAARAAPGFESVEKDHGRIETRRCWQSADTAWFADAPLWEGLRSFALIERAREFPDGRRESARQLYLSSLPVGERRAAQAARDHWGVENPCHWCLDVVFNEDGSRARERNAAKNLGALRKICLNILRSSKAKGSLRSKRMRAALRRSFLVELLSSF